MSEETINITFKIVGMDEVVQLLRSILMKEDTIMAQIDDILADVTDESTVDDSIITLLTSLSAQLAAAGTDSVKLAQVKTLIDSNKAKIAAAVVANTPSATPPANPPTT